jgi:RNA recognition motif-containing protein
MGGSSRNLWVSGLSSSTRATDLKQVFSKYGKVRHSPVLVQIELQLHCSYIIKCQVLYCILVMRL